jgi:hypothetical protein
MENTNRKVRGVRSEWYEAGKFYKLGSEYAGVYTPAVEIPESVGGCLAPNTTHGYVSYEYWSATMNEGAGGWHRTAEMFAEHEKKKWELAKENLKTLEVKS